MDTIVINDDNLNDNNIHKFGNKVRAILLSDDKILVSHYGGVILLPGGSIDKGENIEDAIIRELQEETGIIYDLNQLKYLLTIKYYQLNYLTRNNEYINRLMTTHYYLGHFNGIDLNNIKRTEKEIKDNFNLELISFDDLLSQSDFSDNPRKKYFDRENKEIIKVLKTYKEYNLNEYKYN